jgi:hypothetical protein
MIHEVLEDTQQRRAISKSKRNGFVKEVEIEYFLSISVYKENNPRKRRSRFLI